MMLRRSTLGPLFHIPLACVHTTSSLPAAEETRPPLSPAAAQASFRLAPGLRVDLVAAEPLVETRCLSRSTSEAGSGSSRCATTPTARPRRPARGPHQDPRRPRRRRPSSTRPRSSPTASCSPTACSRGGTGRSSPCPAHRSSSATPTATARPTSARCSTRASPPGTSQLRVSHPTLGPDGWVYVANGLRGGKVAAAAGPTPQPITSRRQGLPVRPGRAGSPRPSPDGPVRPTFDGWGNRLRLRQPHHLRHVVFPDRRPRNPLLAAPLSCRHVAPTERAPGGRVYPLSRNWTTSNLHAGRFTAACGVFVDRGGLCRPRSAAAPSPASRPATSSTARSSSRTGPRSGRSRGRRGSSSWRRRTSGSAPVDLTAGRTARSTRRHVPGGDRTPGVHADELKNRPDLRLGEDRGRIWRVVVARMPSRPTRDGSASRPTPTVSPCWATPIPGIATSRGGC